MGLLGDILGTTDNTANGAGNTDGADTDGGILGLDLDSVVSDVGGVVTDAVAGVGSVVTDAVSDVGTIATEAVDGVATVLGKILVADTDTSSTPASTNDPDPTPTATSSSSSKPPPATSTTTKSTPPPSQPSSTSHSTPPPSPPPQAPPAGGGGEGGDDNGDDNGHEHSSTSQPTVTPKPVSFPVGPGPGDNDGSDGSDDGDSNDSGASGTSSSPSNSDPAASLPPAGSSPSIPAGNAGSTPSLPSPSSTSPSEDPAANSGKHHNTALVAALATIGALLALLALLCLARRYFIARRRARRDAWARRPTDFVEGRPANYGSYDDKNSFAIVARVEVERQDDSPKPRGADLPSGWVDVEKADPVSPPRPFFVTNPTAARQSGVSVESYGNLTREPLTCYRPSGGYASSISSGTPSVTIPPPAIVTSRWSASQETSSGAHADADTNSQRSSVHSLESSESEKSEGARLINDARLSLAYLRQSTMPQPEVEAPAPSPTRRNVNSALMSALFTPTTEPTPALARATSVKSGKHISIYASNEPLPVNSHATDSPRSPSWTPPESWGSAPPSPAPGQTAFGNPAIVVTPAPASPREPRSASGLFVDADPFASPLDRA